MTGPRVAVVGAGAWGTTLAAIIARREPVTLLCHDVAHAAEIESSRRNERRLPGIELPPDLTATADPAALADAADLVIYAVPSSHLRAEAARTAAAVPATADILSVVKGLERESLLRMSEVIAAASDAWRVSRKTSSETIPMSTGSTNRTNTGSMHHP